ncbi:hypothetical protein MUU53_22895 [Rhizobium lemnae]|uniref:Lipoprotein n=1 Tax=Rhizobium lemnae TaxID=1214924 RepID=A0ABV8E998_9HYPH|nr:hypothetical protein [Rhizobium lemnae]MCJ8510694.1 hypothetical protein [Rhizobium lemnae]
MRVRFFAFALLFALAGCSQVTEKAEGMANRSFTSYALGKPYTQVASIGTSPMDRLAGDDRATFGPMIGATPLSNGQMIYRHIAPSARTERGADFGGLVSSSSVMSNNRLSYFLVGQDGIVKDWATGSVPGDATSCMRYIGGIIQQCADMAQQQTSLAIYDSKVLTKDNQPISVWGQPANVMANPQAAGPAVSQPRAPMRAPRG